MGWISKVFYTFVFKRILRDVEKNNGNNIKSLIKVARKITTTEEHRILVQNVLEHAEDPSSGVSKLIKALLLQLSPNVRYTFLKNLIINATLSGRAKARIIARKEGIKVPFAILIDPTSACNLQCIGCWAGEYDQHGALSLQEIDNIIEQGKKLGIYMYVYSGGEPLIRKKDLIRLAEKHQDCAFLAFTNGTLVDEYFVEDLVRVGNFVLAFSIEGIGEATDMRRGVGTYAKVIKSMELMQKAGAGFGYSCCYHSKNIKDVASDEFVDLMIEKGCLFAWYFTYVPIGEDAVIDLIALPQQREFMYQRIRETRNTKPIFAIDFWNDGEFVKGCIGGGTGYFHINAHGDAEPCAFIHYSDVNIKENTLLEVLKSPLFAQYCKNQPFNKNHLRPCPLMDNPDKLKMMVHKSGAHSTQTLDMETVDELTDKLQNVAESWGKVADKIWERTHP